MVSLFAAVALSLAGAPELVLSGDYLIPTTTREEHISPRVDVAAASGEFEMIAMRLENDGETRQLAGVEFFLEEQTALAHVVYRRARPGDFLPGAPEVPDAFTPLAPRSLEAEETLELLIEVQVPQTLDAGRYRATARARFDRGDPEDCTIAFRVYDFSIPPRDLLPVLVDLNLAPFAGMPGMDMGNLDAWAPVYDSVSRLGIGFRVWHEPPRGEAFAGSHAAALREHIRYVARTSDARVVDVGGGPGYLVDQLARPTAAMPQDPLQTWLHDVMGQVSAPDGRTMAVAVPAQFGKRAGWQRIREGNARFARADNRVARILPGPAHPHFERYTDIWALPASTPTAVLERLANGRSLSGYDQDAVSLCIGTEGARDHSGTYQTLASDVTDGSEATFWRAAALGPALDPWLEIAFHERQFLEQMVVLAGADLRFDDIRVDTAYYPGEFNRATVRWNATRRMTETGLSVYEGEFRHPRDCIAVRLTFSPAGADNAPEVAELLFNQDERDTDYKAIEPVIPWLNGQEAKDDAWQSGKAAFGGAPRALPWRCWTLGFQGILGPALNAAIEGGHPLAGMGAGRMLPTRRLFALRDGLEDYEYLNRYWQAIADGAVKPHPAFTPGRDASTFSFTAAGHSARIGARNKIGKALSGDSLVTTNFGP